MQPGVTRASVLISRSTSPVLARMAWLLARQNPTFSSLAITCTDGQLAGQVLDRAVGRRVVDDDDLVA